MIHSAHATHTMFGRKQWMQTLSAYVALTALTLGGCTALASDVTLPHPRPPIVSDAFRPALAYGEIRELNALAGDVSPELLLRLFETPARGDCVAETHAVCGYTYFLSASTSDEQPEIGLFRLETTGEVTDIMWTDNQETDSAELVLTVTAYPAQAVRLNPELSSTSRRVRLSVTPTSVTETPLNATR